MEKRGEGRETEVAGPEICDPVKIIQEVLQECRRGGEERGDEEGSQGRGRAEGGEWNGT